MVITAESTSPSGQIEVGLDELRHARRVLVLQLGHVKAVITERTSPAVRIAAAVDVGAARESLLRKVAGVSPSGYLQAAEPSSSPAPDLLPVALDH